MPAERGKIERISAEELEARLPQPAALLPLEQIVALVRQGIGAGEIIDRMTGTGSRYRLSATQIVELARQGVPLSVLDHMVSAERTHIFDDLAGDAVRREQMCKERIADEARLCRRQVLPPLWSPWQPTFMDCVPPRAGAPFWRCL